MIEPEVIKVYLTVRGFLPLICKVITNEIDNIRQQEYSSSFNKFSVKKKYFNYDTQANNNFARYKKKLQ
jgi:hypothetical protein